MDSKERLLSKKAHPASPRDDYRPDLYHYNEIYDIFIRFSFALEDGLQFMTLAASALCQVQSPLYSPYSIVIG